MPSYSSFLFSCPFFPPPLFSPPGASRRKGNFPPFLVANSLGCIWAFCGFKGTAWAPQGSGLAKETWNIPRFLRGEEFLKGYIVEKENLESFAGARMLRQKKGKGGGGNVKIPPWKQIPPDRRKSIWCPAKPKWWRVFLTLLLQILVDNFPSIFYNFLYILKIFLIFPLAQHSPKLPGDFQAPFS